MKNIKFVRTSGKIKNTIDLEQIKTESYVSFFDFRTDILWFIHNCFILHWADEDIKTAIKLLIQYVDEEIESVFDCTQCYSNAYKHSDDGFVMLCEPPHPIIWARSDGFRFWPAKALRITGETVRARYFGDHTNAVVPLTSCYSYSTEPPIKSTVSDELYESALQVYIFLLSFFIQTSYNIITQCATKIIIIFQEVEQHIKELINFFAYDLESKAIPFDPTKWNLVKKLQTTIAADTVLDTKVMTTTIPRRPSLTRSSQSSSPSDLSSSKNDTCNNDDYTPSPKKARVDEEIDVESSGSEEESSDGSGSGPDECWFEMQQTYMKKCLKHVEKKINVCNTKSWRRISQLEGVVRDVSNQKFNFEQQIDELKKKGEEHDVEKKELTEKIRKLEEEVSQYAKKDTACKGCGTTLESVRFCSSKCYESDFK